MVDILILSLLLCLSVLILRRFNSVLVAVPSGYDKKDPLCHTVEAIELLALDSH